MYKILIVEDEQDSRKGLAELIMLHDSSIQITTCGDGMEGYQTALKTSPDIIISDIRMPHCDGIAMVKKLRQKNFAGKIFLLTGYADFSYAQQAIRYGVSEYILKPIVPSEFLSLLEQSLHAVAREKLINNQKDSNIVYLFSETDNTALKSKLFHLRYTECFFAILYLGSESHIPPKMKEILLLEKDLHLAYLPDKQFRGICIGFHDNSINHSVIAKLNVLLKEYETVTCVYTILNLQAAESLKTIWEKLQNAVIWSITYSSRFINYTSTMGEKSEPYKEDKYLKSELQKLQCRHAYKDYGNLLLQYLEKMRRKQLHPLLIRMTAVSSLIKIGTEQQYFLAVEQLSQAMTFQEIASSIKAYFSDVSDCDTSGYSKLVQQAIRELDEHYAKPISLNSVAEKLRITPPYLSKIFMRETSTTFVNYLTALRMERAKLLLKNTNKKINVICQQVGYPDPKYFCTLFKKETGVTPNQYRSNNI
ncbi:MAG: response regulator [Lachnospiraceae bacterium]|jgi:two-component system response regulator YesN|nr:response regulator [Lachnospiraceae bacterium]